jgi:hypothetical protein
MKIESEELKNMLNKPLPVFFKYGILVIFFIACISFSLYYLS